MTTLSYPLAATLTALALFAGCQAPPESVELGSADLAMAEADLADFDDGVPLDPTAASSAPARPAAVAADPAAPPPETTLGRHLRRSADLRVSTDDYAETLRAARALAGRYGGLVTGEDGSAYGSDLAQTTLTLRVPSDRFDAALDALAALGRVESRAVSVDDVTGQVVDLEARIRAKRAAEARYVTFVGQAGSIGEMLEVQRQLDGVRSEIEAMESHIRSLRGAVSLSTIRATIVGPALVAPPPATPGVWALAAQAIAQGWHGLLAVLIGVLPLWPLALLGALAGAAWRRWQRPVAA